MTRLQLLFSSSSNCTQQNVRNTQEVFATLNGLQRRCSEGAGVEEASPHVRVSRFADGCEQSSTQIHRVARSASRQVERVAHTLYSMRLSCGGKSDANEKRVTCIGRLGSDFEAQSGGWALRTLETAEETRLCRGPTCASNGKTCLIVSALILLQFSCFFAKEIARIRLPNC